VAELALFPLRTVLFPDGLLELKIFEARYLDLMSACLRESVPFGVVALRAGSEARRPDAAESVSL
jgi:Lon protease-like protein